MEQWLKFKEIFIGIVKYVFPTIALALSILSYKDSRRINKVQTRLIEIEKELKKYELEEKEKERMEANKACVEARIVKVSKGKYVMKIWNSGKGTAYNVDFEIPEECRSMVFRDKVPYEFLEPGKNFEEHVVASFSSSNKFKITTIWNDEQGDNHSKEQIVTL